MAWTIKLTQLNEVLSDLVPIKDNIEKYVKDAGLKMKHIDTGGSADNVWSNVLSEADKHEMVDNLVNAVLRVYPNDPFLKAALADEEVDYTLDKKIDPKWENFESQQLEKLTMEQSTLLQINFLAKGVIKSRSIEKIEVRNGDNTVGKGTGFLMKVKGIDDLFFISNNHVLPDRNRLDKIKVVFDYELGIDDETKVSKSFVIDKEGCFYSSPVNELDATICKLLDPNNELAEYGYLELDYIDLPADRFVNIIQHLAGELKQISLYDNVITYNDDRIVQYLTDTLRGSSGSPVFNSNWDVVALHHSGGEKRHGEVDLPPGFKSRNEGIVINRIIEFTKDCYAKNN